MTDWRGVAEMTSPNTARADNFTPPAGPARFPGGEPPATGGAGLDATRLENVKTHDRKTTAACPACRESGNDSSGDHLFIDSQGRFGCIAFPGASGKEHRQRIFALVGIKKDTPRPFPATSAPRPKPKRKRKIHASLDKASGAAKWSVEQRTESEVHETRRDIYSDPDGPDLIEFRFDPGKEFRTAHAVEGGFVLGDPARKLPLFRKPELLESAGGVCVVEGPKDALAGVGIGLNCTTSAHGAKSPSKTDWKPLKGRDVAILPDNDAAGRGYAKAVAKLVHKAGAKSIRIVELPGLSEKGDLADFIGNGGTVEDVRAAIKTASLWTPDAKSDTKQPAEPLALDYYDAVRKEYMCLNSERIWNRFTETQYKRILKGRGKSSTLFEGDLLSEVDTAILDAQDTRSLVYAGELAGWPSGVHEISSGRILVQRGPVLILSGDGDFPNLRRLLESLLCDTPEQLPVFVAWLKVAVESLEKRILRPGQALCLAGAHDTGKSFVQREIVTRILGGRLARPYQYMIGRTDFNADLFTAEHLVIEDDVASTKLQDRRAFGARIKEITANEQARLHAKNRDALMLTPFWRLSITVNDEPENLMILPPMDESLEDKIILLKAQKGMLPCETETPEGRKRCVEMLISELPAFVAFLHQWEIPNEWRGGRYGVREYHHPDLLKTLAELSPESKLAELIDRELFSGELCMPWTGRAADLEHTLTSSDVAGYEARRLLSFNTACGVYLARLANKWPERYERKHTESGNEWTVYPPRNGKKSEHKNNPERVERVFKSISNKEVKKSIAEEVPNATQNTAQPSNSPSALSVEEGGSSLPEGWDRSL